LPVSGNSQRGGASHSLVSRPKQIEKERERERDRETLPVLVAAATASKKADFPRDLFFLFSVFLPSFSLQAISTQPLSAKRCLLLPLFFLLPLFNNLTAAKASCPSVRI
jgi:hypothetical protein